MHSHIQRLLHCIELEEKEQAIRYQLNQQHSLKQLKAEGLALHPVNIIRKSFGYADYPEMQFRVSYMPETHLFKDGAAIECFVQGEEPVKGILLYLDGNHGAFRLYAPDFPEWLESPGMGIKLAPDTHTTEVMKKALRSLEKHPTLRERFERLHGTAPLQTPHSEDVAQLRFFNTQLNPSQQKAVAGILACKDMAIVHGPPGTGKTYTLVEAIQQMISRGEKVLAAAPSNTAVDHLVKQLIAAGIKVLRVGNANKADEAVFAHTPEGIFSKSKEQKAIKELRQRADAFRRMALKYKRNFGKEERAQRQLLLQEVKSIRAQIKQLQDYHENKMIEAADVVAGTPVGLYDARLHNHRFEWLVLDEAGQCIEPLAWSIFPLAPKWVLVGDHCQLPPTVLSTEAALQGFNISILEKAIQHCPAVYLLNTQYRMRQAIAGFSSLWFYHNLLHTAEHLHNTGTHLTFIDTAGAGLDESPGLDGLSLVNIGELHIAQQLLWNEPEAIHDTAFIAPYAAQVAAAKDILPEGVKLSTIDSFQGQEKHRIILSLVRSNEEGDIGFLKDYRRMNVAITRAKEELIIIGNSATLANDAFYLALLQYVEKHGAYRSAWEFDLSGC